GPGELLRPLPDAPAGGEGDGPKGSPQGDERRVVRHVTAARVRTRHRRRRRIRGGAARRRGLRRRGLRRGRRRTVARGGRARRRLVMARRGGRGDVRVVAVDGRGMTAVAVVDVRVVEMAGRQGPGGAARDVPPLQALQAEPCGVRLAAASHGRRAGLEPVVAQPGQEVANHVVVLVEQGSVGLHSPLPVTSRPDPPCDGQHALFPPGAYVARRASRIAPRFTGLRTLTAIVYPETPPGARGTARRLAGFSRRGTAADLGHVTLEPVDPVAQRLDLLQELP